MTKRSEETRQIVKSAIAEHGVDAVKHDISPPFIKMVTGTRAKKQYGFGRIVAVGFQDIDPDCLEVAIECIVEAMPDGDDKTRIATDLTYWRENRQEIMDDHHVTPAEPEAK